MVSRMTVRMAISELVNKGYLECMRGVGTMVVYGKIEETLKHITSFTEEMQQHGITMQTAHCEICRVSAPEKVSDALELESGAPVYRLTRVRCADQVPLVYSVTYLSVEQLSMDAACYKDSLYACLAQDYGISIRNCDDALEALMADAAVAKMLHVSRPCAIFKRTRVGSDQDGRKVEFSTSYYPGDKYKYSVHL